MRAACLLVAVVSLASASARADDDGVTTDTFAGSDGRQVSVRVMSVTPNDTRLRVLYAPAVLGKYDVPTDLRALSAAPDLAPPKHRQRNLFSAGFSSYRTDVAVGLLVSDGKLHSPVDASPPRAQVQPGCNVASVARYRLAGILCVPATAGTEAWRIIATADYQPGQCKEAVQSGPLLVEPGGKPGICAAPDRAAPQAASARLAACIDKTGNLHMALSEPTALYPFSQWLLNGRLKCVAALNFSGAEQAGWARLATWKKPIPKYFGGVESPLASALLFERK